MRDQWKSIFHSVTTLKLYVLLGEWSVHGEWDKYVGESVYPFCGVGLTLLKIKLKKTKSV